MLIIHMHRKHPRDIRFTPILLIVLRHRRSHPSRRALLIFISLPAVAPIENLATTAKHLYLKDYRNYFKKNKVVSDRLTHGGAYTVFAPENKAFNNLPQNTRSVWTSHPRPSFFNRPVALLETSSAAVAKTNQHGFD